MSGILGAGTPLTSAELAAIEALGTPVNGEVVSGSGTSWTLGHTPLTGTLALFAEGQRIATTTDYTAAGTAITTVISWPAGAILADYSY